MHLNIFMITVHFTRQNVAVCKSWCKGGGKHDSKHGGCAKMYLMLRTAVQKCILATRTFDEQKFIFARQMFSTATHPWFAPSAKQHNRAKHNCGEAAMK